MVGKFTDPSFEIGDIELRYEDGEICIYATNAGLEKLMTFCESLKEAKGTNHIHLDDYSVLTEKSLRGVISKFEN